MQNDSFIRAPMSANALFIVPYITAISQTAKFQKHSFVQVWWIGDNFENEYTPASCWLFNCTLSAKTGRVYLTCERIECPSRFDDRLRRSERKQHALQKTNPTLANFKSSFLICPFWNEWSNSIWMIWFPALHVAVFCYEPPKSRSNPCKIPVVKLR